jgi:hypothetical protein
MNKNYICNYDFETLGIGVDPHTCEPFQLAAMIIHPRKLEFVKDGLFKSFMKPPNYDQLPDEAFEYHAKVRKCAIADIRKLIEDAPSQESVWKDFVNFLSMYHADGATRKSMFSAPVRAGMNIRDFDNIIWDRLCIRYGNVTPKGEPNISHPRDCIDLKEICFYWFENKHEPQKYNMDYMRPYFGLSEAGGHDAEFDTRQVGHLLMKFMSLHRLTSDKVKFEGAFKGTGI